MRQEINAFFEVCDRFSSANAFSLPAGLGVHEVVAALEKSARERAKLKMDFNHLLTEKIDPLLNSGILSDEEDDDLFKIAQRFSSYTERNDPEFALKIYRALLERARNHGDRDRTIKYLYWCAITLFFSNLAIRNDSLAFFKEGASYKNEYFEIDSKETRQYIHRCMGNVTMCLRITDGMVAESLLVEEENMAFWNKVIFSGADSNFPWSAYFLNCYSQRHSRHTVMPLRDLRNLRPTREQLAENLKIAQTANRLYYANKSVGATYGGTRYDLILWEAQLCSGLISFTQFVANIEKRQAEIAPDDYSADALYCHIQLNAYAMFYAKKLLPDNEYRRQLIASLSQKTYDYCTGIPVKTNPNLVETYLTLYAANAATFIPQREHMQLILQLTTYMHIPLYAHSITVSRIARLAMETLLLKNPSALIGLCGTTSLTEVISGREALLEAADLAGLCHDLGKLYFISSLSLNSHPFSKEEQLLIREHTAKGRYLLERPDVDLKTLPYPDVVQGHHRHYDGVGGYPESFDINLSPHKVLIHIITLANVLESDTNTIERQDALPLDAACASIREQSGSKFSPELVAFLDDSGFMANLQTLLSEGRLEAYEIAYRHAVSIPDERKGEDK
jgi:HD-GYP domain